MITHACVVVSSYTLLLVRFKEYSAARNAVKLIEEQKLKKHDLKTIRLVMYEQIKALKIRVINLALFFVQTRGASRLHDYGYGC